MKKFLKIALPIFVGVFLCWYAYRQFNEEQFVQIKHTFLNADYFYIILAVFLGFLTYFNRIDAGDSVNDAFEAAFAVFIILFLTGIFAFCFVFAVAKLTEQEQKSK